MDRPEIRLYSASPRRSELLSRIGIPYIVDPVDIDETLPPNMNADDAVSFISKRKLAAGLKLSPENSLEWGLAADTLVEVDGIALGKPRDSQEAEAMLRSLSGRFHAVHTAVSLHAPAEDSDHPPMTSVHTTLVRFRELKSPEIRLYLSSGEWTGAAGAYRIQGLGAVFVDHIEGLWSTVVGLPLSPLYGMLATVSYPLG
ncbi:MAG: Maf family protein [Spirochaetaceae bacterium]|nr:Maf family protein [Spirochaetaceae bacterium]